MTSDLSISGREAVADWIETTLVARGTRQVGSDALYSLASEEINCGVPQANLALGVMKRRALALGDRYPFTVHEWAVRATPYAMTSPYVALLYLSTDGVARQLLYRTPNDEMAVLLERLTERAVQNLWGDVGRALRFGWPSDSGRPPEFPAAVAWLAEKMSIPAGTGYRPPRRKDGGVDVVGWRPFPDKRSGFPIVLVQCTLQSDLVPKAADIEARLWSSLLALDVEPATVLAVPQTLSPGVLWDQLALRCMILERLRLTGLIPPDAAAPGMQDWLRDTTKRLGEVLLGAQA